MPPVTSRSKLIVGRVVGLIIAVLLLTAIIDVAVLYAAGHPLREYLIENSDLLYLPTLFDDLVNRGGHFADWYLTPAPYFFPDYPAYSVAYFLAPTTYTRILAYGVVQTLATTAILWVLAHGLVRANAWNIAVAVTIGVLWLATAAGEPFVLVLASATHYGSFLSALLLGALWIQFAKAASRTPRILLLAAIVLVVALASLSDNLFLVNAVVPFVAATMLARVRSAGVPHGMHRLALGIAWVVVALAVPAAMYRLTILPPTVSIQWMSAVDNSRRAALEARFHLVDGDFRGDAVWTYHLLNTSPANVAAIVRDPGIEQTGHINRESLHVDGSAGHLVRAVATIPVGVVIATIAILGWVFAVATWRRIRAREPVIDAVLLVMVVASSALGSFSYHFVVANPTRYPPSFGLEKAFGNLSDLWENVSRAFAADPWWAAVAVAFTGLMVWVLTPSFARDTGSHSQTSLRWFCSFAMASIGCTCVALALMTDLPVMSRYLIPIFFLPIVVVALLLGHLLGQRTVLVTAAVSLLGAAALTSTARAMAATNGISWRHYPADVACMDDALEQAGAANGVAQYWDAKYLQQFSRLDLNVAQYLETLEPMPWITSKRYFKNAYDFAVAAENAEPGYKISLDVLSKVNGPPRRVVRCGDRTVYIYERGSLRMAAPAQSRQVR